ncbi:MAG: DUF1572 family protein [Longimicrobiaceae bacterium]
MIAEHYLQDVLLQLRKYRDMAEKAIAQISEEQLFGALDPESNSIALIMKHMAGNMRSRWTDFLTTDGEKPDRQRDREFLIEEVDTAAHVRAQWEDGWARTLSAIESLRPDELSRVVTIRGEPHTVLEAINRQLMHYAAHVGQIVLLAKHYAGEQWQSLSIPKGRSGEFDVSKQGTAYPDEGTR